MKITIISDNYVDTACLVAEHGFSCLIEAESSKILFDTGQGEALLNNMRRLNIPRDIGMIVFSHGHYDHTGGLSRYPDELAEYSKDIYASRYIFDEHLKKTKGGQYAYIGFEAERTEVEQKYKLHLNGSMTEISKNIFLSGPITRYEEFSADTLLYSKVGGEYGKDMFRDEQYLVVKVPEGIHIITGCTHCGAANLLMDAKDKFPETRILSLTGGLHMFRSKEQQVEHVIQFLEKEDVQSINTGHCTGLDAAIQMKQRLGERVSITKAGMVINL
jgi:7,8-dihydropterin-6-yl-methyl-4-(beta-D-ribofuranosyl)aminobenzene 5'-phosphate synthase